MALTGRPLELDTDGIWCTLPATFPENVVFKFNLDPEIDKGLKPTYGAGRRCQWRLARGEND